MRKILILYDNRGFTADSQVPESGRKLDIKLLKSQFENKGFQVHTKGLHELVFPSMYHGWYVIYPSSEDYGLFYKSFIEDILLRLELDGAILLPEFKYFRAHHNKVFMELLRTLMSQEYQTLSSEAFYSVNDLKRIIRNPVTYPVVLKSGAGAGSMGVTIAYNEKELLRKARKMGKIKYCGIGYTRINQIRYYIGAKKRKLLGIKIVEQPKPREKMIFQEFIPDLLHDYKVLIFGDIYGEPFADSSQIPTCLLSCLAKKRLRFL